MARIYSQSQRKFIDMPDTTGGGQVQQMAQPQLQPQPQQQVGQTGQIQKILGMMALRKGDITSATKLLGLEPEDKESGVGKIAAKDRALAATGKRTVTQAVGIFRKDPSVITKQLIPGKFASREWDTVMYDAADALLRLRTGAQANPTEIRGYMKTLAPSFGDSPEVVELKLNKMLADFADYSGETPQIIDIETGKKKKSPGVTLGAILGGAGGFLVGGPVGAGLGAAAGGAGGGVVQESLESLLGKQQEQPLEQVGRVGAEALGAGVKGLTIGSLLGLTGAARGLTSPGKAIPSGSGIGQKVVGASEKIKQVTPKAIFGKRQAEAAKALSPKVKVSTGKLFKSAERYIESDPTAKKILDANKSAIESAKTVPKLLDRMSTWGKAYSSAARVGKSSKAGLFDSLYKAGLQELKTKAPEVYKNRRLLGLSYELPKTASKALWRALQGKLLTSGF